MIFNLINFIRFLSKEDYERFIRFSGECRNYPYFSTLYDINDFDNDVNYFKELLNTKEEKK